MPGDTYTYPWPFASPHLFYPAPLLEYSKCGRWVVCAHVPAEGHVLSSLPASVVIPAGDETVVHYLLHHYLYGAGQATDQLWGPSNHRSAQRKRHSVRETARVRPQAVAASAAKLLMSALTHLLPPSALFAVSASENLRPELAAIELACTQCTVVRSWLARLRSPLAPRLLGAF